MSPVHQFDDLTVLSIQMQHKYGKLPRGAPFDAKVPCKFWPVIFVKDLQDQSHTINGEIKQKLVTFKFKKRVYQIPSHTFTADNEPTILLDVPTKARNVRITVRGTWKAFQYVDRYALSEAVAELKEALDHFRFAPDLSICVENVNKTPKHSKLPNVTVNLTGYPSGPEWWKEEL